MVSRAKRRIAVFYCRNTPGSGEEEGRSLERTYGDRLRLYPVPCSDKVESLHVLKALEEFADAVYVIACPEEACRNIGGTRRVRKRVEKAQAIISGIGLETERVGIVTGSLTGEKPFRALVEDLIALSVELRPSPVHNRAT